MERDIDELLRLWTLNKSEIAELEKKNLMYRTYVEKLMNKSNSDDLDGRNYRASRSNVIRETIGKKDVPIDIWNKYCKRTSFFTYSIREKK